MQTDSDGVIATLLLAAGRGERMRPLTDHTPKPLLQVRGKPLLQWRMEALLQGGFERVVINTAWLGDQIEAQFGSAFNPDGTGEKAEPAKRVSAARAADAGKCANPAETGAPAARALQLAYSREGRDFGRALETAGGICRALPQLGDAFWVMAGDVFAPDFAFQQQDVQRFLASGMLAHIWLVPNPEHNPAGDFGLDAHTGLALNLPKGTLHPRFTFSTIALYRRELFLPPWCDIPPGNPEGNSLKLAPLLRAAMDQQRVSAALYTGAWTDVGTPERLALLNAEAAPQAH
jgi:MurNAc alpha-1-phosphate uridylyltransferase